MQVYSEFSIIFVSEFIISLFSNVLGRSLFNLTFRLTGSCKDGSECSLALFPSMSQVTRVGHSNKVRTSVCTQCVQMCVSSMAVRMQGCPPSSQRPYSCHLLLTSTPSCSLEVPVFPVLCKGNWDLLLSCPGIPLTFILAVGCQQSGPISRLSGVPLLNTWPFTH